MLKEGLLETTLSEPLVIEGRQFFAIADAARQERVHRTLLWKLLQEGVLEGRRAGEMWLISSDSLGKWRTNLPKIGRPRGSRLLPGRPGTSQERWRGSIALDIGEYTNDSVVLSRVLSVAMSIPEDAFVGLTETEVQDRAHAYLEYALRQGRHPRWMKPEWSDGLGLPRPRNRHPAT